MNKQKERMAAGTVTRSPKKGSFSVSQLLCAVKRIGFGIVGVFSALGCLLFAGAMIEHTLPLWEAALSLAICILVTALAGEGMIMDWGLKDGEK